ncbi:3-hydroxyacyl-CoA dehydrogenase family protein [Leucobacter denitrificans]|uniref:3-hydroxyacyl-CoA dehydrogenase family protein n=1 Tax=Leucobacter denitrificans TaxID=683042 RepID=UPI001CB7550B|nr:3-hydroxyacyl-CoA dehydrogenase NAD-binding domain-containing protein [Leucobacter denitrificans]
MSTPRNITVLGSGIMGPGIAAVFARSGADVTIYDVVQDALDRAAEGVKVAEGVLDKLDAARGDRQGELSFTTSIEEALAKAEYVLEAVPEREDLKKQVIAQVESLVGPEVIIASNTSGIPITKLAEDMKHPERFVGMHWSNPPHVIPSSRWFRASKPAMQLVMLSLRSPTPSDTRLYLRARFLALLRTASCTRLCVKASRSSTKASSRRKTWTFVCGGALASSSP